MTNGEYTRKLESIIKQMLQPLKNIPLNVVIDAISDKKVLQFDKNNEIHKSFLSKLKKAALSAGKEINKKGIQRPRPNEVGNDIEIFVKEALGKFGILAETIGGNPVYKCKTYKILSIEKLLVDVKYEFNSDNKRLYSYNHGTILLAEGLV